ncbi:hypothetical protein F8A10_07775 [Paracoccus kondratievae]|uniref:DUF1376 domain-containing protein n=1 Tax=Paracoccus kondratievae TaxID=135740 RepID=A0AAD3P206_9RHOB|nr:hypothetical protein [Paracoccus kondratievae]QFQ87330.1 hypothetical protein F8A10_07775 [Paracoccus kondratievae]GLK65674.1 hypothetical protein GCM10017635_31510 [Paracoccus kondratievae]
MNAFHVVPTNELEDYPLTVEDRLDSHYFMAWERRRWLNSDMRLRGTAECRALFFDLINISYDQAPVGTLPNDCDLLAKMLFVDPAHFRQLCRLEFGPLHKWVPVRCGDEIRLSHPMVLRSLKEAIARREDHRARSEAASTKKRLQRLRSCMAGINADLATKDGAVLWIDGWLQSQGCEYRSAEWIERGIGAWMNHSLQLNLRKRQSG